ncbi:putative phage abortive infection protein [Aeromonas salmonicida]|uniref:putative phage abortive infection protein n=1 Tax=Aeromonas salmonicida TaxID=645 RepID=UPI003CE8E6A2
MFSIDILGGNKTFGNDLGPFGDVYGALNTLFSGLAFAGLIISIRLQSSELKETRNEMSRQSTQFESQAKALDRQVFENTLFQLLGFNNQIINSANIDVKVALQAHELVHVYGNGREAFKSLYRYLVKLLKANQFTTHSDTYVRFHNDFGDTLGHYFRNIYQILKLIDASSFSAQEKKDYSNMLRAQLSKYELGMLFYNCISPLGSDKFKPLLEKYEFLEHLANDFEPTYSDLLSYNISVFGWSNRLRFVESLLARAEIADSQPEKYILYAYYDDNPIPEDATRLGLVNIYSMLNNREIIWLEHVEKQS